MNGIIKGKAAPLLLDNVDTDQIIPAQFLKLLEKKGLGKYLFYRWRYYDDGKPREGFVLNDPRFSDATILVSLRNFGIGSSRENAVWALVDYGFRAVLASSFGDIFYENSVKNGLACVRLPVEALSEIGQLAMKGDLFVEVDLNRKVVRYAGKETQFDMEESVRKRLLSGKSEIDYTLENYSKSIEEYERRAPAFLARGISEDSRKLIEG